MDLSRILVVLVWAILVCIGLLAFWLRGWPPVRAAMDWVAQPGVRWFLGILFGIGIFASGWILRGPSEFIAEPTTATPTSGINIAQDAPNNSGTVIGQVSGDINLARKDRTLDDANKAKLSEWLKSQTVKLILVQALNGDAETYRYAQQIYAYVESLGYTAGIGVGMSPTSFQGVRGYPANTEGMVSINVGPQ